MSGNLKDKKYYPDERFTIPKLNQQKENPYDINSEIIQDMVARGIEPFKVMVLDLSVQSGGASAPAQGYWQEIKIPGNHIVLYGFDSGEVNQSCITSAFAQIYYGPNRPADEATFLGFPLKHNRGISGPFDRFFIRWPAQVTTDIKANLIVMRYQYLPWIGGEAAT